MYRQSEAYLSAGILPPVWKATNINEWMPCGLRQKAVTLNFQKWKWYMRGHHSAWRTYLMFLLLLLLPLALFQEDHIAIFSFAMQFPTPGRALCCHLRGAELNQLRIYWSGEVSDSIFASLLCSAPAFGIYEQAAKESKYISWSEWNKLVCIYAKRGIITSREEGGRIYMSVWKCTSTCSKVDRKVFLFFLK